MKINLQKDFELGIELKVKGWPTLVFSNNNNYEVYSSFKDEEYLIEWLLRKSGIHFKTLE